MVLAAIPGCVREGYQEHAIDETPVPLNARDARSWWFGGATPVGRYGLDAGAALVLDGAAGNLATPQPDAAVPPAPDAATPDAAVPDSAMPAPDPLLGTWWAQGVSDVSSTTYDVCMTVTRADPVGIVAGDVVYDNGVDCSGYITLVARSGSAYSLDETITAGADESYCTLGGGGRIEATVTSPDALNWTWRRRNGTAVLSAATLARVDKCP